MIPLRLNLTNFLSYKEMPEPLDLETVHLACLSGSNGNGKSALLDAITWSLWGKARGCESGHDQERLIRDGADAMSVEFTFGLEGQTFRVVRTRWRNGKGDIGFSVQAADGSWTDMAGEGKRDTQDRIIERLRMDYETFVASAFILQGRADTFTRLEPRERKDVLAKILGLEVYERLADHARAKKKEAQADAEAHTRALDRLERDLAEREDLERRKTEATVALTRAEADRADADAAPKTLQGSLTELRALEATARETEKRRDEATGTLADEEAEIARLKQRESELGAAVKVDAHVKKEAAQVPALEREETRLTEARTRHDELTAEAASLEGRLGEERSRLDAERLGHERAAGRLEKELAAEKDARALLDRARAEVASSDEAAAERERLLARRSEIRERRATIDAETQGRATERDEIEEKLALLTTPGGGCPLCGQDLTPAHRREVKASFGARQRTLTIADRTATKETKALAAELATVDAEGKALKAALETREKIAAQAAALEQQLERMATARGELDAARRAATEIAERLKADDYAAPEREKLARVREELAAVGFDAKAYQILKKALDNARKAERAIATAREAAAALDACGKQIGSATERAERARAATAAAIKDLTAMGERLARLPALVEEHAIAERTRAAAQTLVDETGRTLAACTHALDVLQREEAAAAEERKALAAAKKLARLYEKLAKAFGRDGIPARIIGNAIPELGQEANRLLALLSDGQFTISIDPIRETKGGKLKETLEISVYDASGKRPYEMYSGGERLRIDFALRVALSHLLATRAGARLETLVIDEGFGSQDTEGRLRLLEAVMRVRSEFRTVLVITHIEELKEHFPVRIEISKDPVTGSRVSVV
ncbi:MAG: SMC family ATPase [Actinomycetota bacterium]